MSVSGAAGRADIPHGGQPPDASAVSTFQSADGSAAPETLRLWSVTTLIGLGLGTSDALIGWSWNTAAAAAVDLHPAIAKLLEMNNREAAVGLIKQQRWQKRGQALSRGTEVHKAAEQLAKGLPITIEDHMMPWVNQYRRFLADHSPRFEMAEAPVYNTRARYAGTLDAIVEIDGSLCVLDMKTTDKGPDAASRPPYSDVALQLCAYAHAEEVGIGPAVRRYDGGRRYYIYDPEAGMHPMPKVAGALALVVSPVDYTLTPVRVDDEVWGAFTWVKACAHWQADISKRVFGPPIGGGGK